MNNFSIKQFACRCWCNMPDVVRENLEALVANILDPVVENFSKQVGFDELPEEERRSPIKINAGYICRKHLAELGLSNRLQYDKGEAVDVSAEPKYYSNMMEWREANRLLAGMVIKNGKFDTIILVNVGEDNLNPQWLHITYSRSVNRGIVKKKISGQNDYIDLMTEEIASLLGSNFKVKNKRM